MQYLARKILLAGLSDTDRLSLRNSGKFRWSVKTSGLWGLGLLLPVDPSRRNIFFYAI